MLQTATAQISSNFQIAKTETVNIIFDNLSRRSYINDNLRKRLKLPVIRKEKLVIKTFANLDSKLYNADVSPVQFVIGQKVIVIECLCSSFIFFFSFISLNKSINSFVSKIYPPLNGLFLADTSPGGNKKIEVLIGADNY